MKIFRIETPDFFFYMDAKSVLDAIEQIVIKYGESFARTITLIKEF